MSEYIFKTDRDKQWNDKKKRTTELTRKQIKELEHYFYTGEIPADYKWSIETLLFYNPVLSVESWQEVLSNKANVVTKIGDGLRFRDMDAFFGHLQQAFLGYISSYDFHPEDRAWIFKQIFGEVYDPERQFPLIFPTETEKRKISFGVENILSSLFHDYSKFYRNKTDNLFANFLLDYLISTLSYVNTAEMFDLKESPNEDLELIRQTFIKTIHLANQDIDTSSAEMKPKIELARELKSIFDQYEGDLGNYHQLVEKVEREGPLV